MTDLTQHCQKLMDRLDPAEREVFDKAYAAAWRAMELAGIIYRAREAAGLTHAELARRIDMPRSAIAVVESGARTPTR